MIMMTLWRKEYWALNGLYLNPKRRTEQTPGKGELIGMLTGALALVSRMVKVN